MTGLGAQLGNFKHGIGTKYPFRFLTFKDKTAFELKTALEELNLKVFPLKLWIRSNRVVKLYRVYISLKIGQNGSLLNLLLQ